jgi:hypothetical protein
VSNGTGWELRVLGPRKVPEQTGLKMEVLELRTGPRMEPKLEPRVPELRTGPKVLELGFP